MQTLSTVHAGDKAKVVKIEAGKILSAQLKHMGIAEGDVLKVMQNIQGYLIVAKGHLRLALGRGMGHKIFVEKLRQD